MAFDERGIAISDQRDGTPNGYHILEVDSTDLTVRFKGAGKPADQQMRIRFDVAHHQLQPNGIRDFKAGQLLDGHLSQDELAAASSWSTSLTAAPNPSSLTESTTANIQPLTRTPRKDPYMLEQFVRHASDKKSLCRQRSQAYFRGRPEC